MQREQDKQQDGLGGSIMIREATLEDLRAILHIYNDAIVNTTSVYDYEPHSFESRVQWFEQKRKDQIPVLVHEIEGRICGFASYGPFRNWPAYQYTIEHSVYVDPICRNKGVGSRLLREIIYKAKQNGYKTMIAGIDQENKGSISLHERHQFTYCGTLKKVGYKFNKWLDLNFYQLDLEHVTITKNSSQ